MQGWYLPEAAHPYYILSPHHIIDFASPAGPNPPVDELSVQVGSRCGQDHLLFDANEKAYLLAELYR